MNKFENRLEIIKNTEFHGPIIDVMDTLETVCMGLDVISGQQNIYFDGTDAVELTKLVLARLK